MDGGLTIVSTVRLFVAHAERTESFGVMGTLISTAKMHTFKVKNFVPEARRIATRTLKHLAPMNSGPVTSSPSLSSSLQHPDAQMVFLARC